jgi:hypothetical protein
MTYGDFAWDSLKRPKRQRDRRSRPRAVLVEGDPVPWMEPGEDMWAWKVRRSLPHPFDRPYLTFILPTVRRRGSWGLDDYLQPIMYEMKSTPISLWAKLTEGERAGIRIADAAPAFPPKFERTISIESPAGYCEAADVESALESELPIGGQSDIGLHITLKRLSRDDYDFGGNVRTIFDGLSTLLGGDLTRPADKRIRDLRVVRDTHCGDVIELRLWQILDDRRD